MRQGISTRWALLVAGTVLVAGCADGGFRDRGRPAQAGVTTSAQTSVTPPDSGLRPVKIPYADGIGYVLPETAAQALCQALTSHDWRELFGGDVGRKIVNKVSDATCVLTSGALSVELSMLEHALADVGATSETIGGYQVRLRQTDEKQAWALAAVLPVGEKDLNAQRASNANPVLQMTASVSPQGTNADLAGLIRRILATLLPRLISDGPKTPIESSPSRVPYVPTEPPPGVPLYDLPRSVQGLVLCTAITKASRTRPAEDQIRVNGVGECQFPGQPSVFAEVDKNGHKIDDGDFMIAGRPARFDGKGVEIELATLPASRDNQRTQSLVLNLYRDYSDTTELRTWADKVAASLRLA